MFVIPAPLRLVLASGSPRRRELLASAGLEFSIRPPDIDETPASGEPPMTYVERLSIEKAAAVMVVPDAMDTDIVIAADTTVEVGGLILEKPIDDEDARSMLRRLSGRDHQVHTGVTVSWPETGGRRSATSVVTTSVTFADLLDDQIEWYVSTGEAADKAGAYGVQGSAAGLVVAVNGSVTNVIGLPLAETLDLLRVALASSRV